MAELETQLNSPIENVASEHVNEQINMPVNAGSEHEASCCNAVVYCCRTAVRGAATGRYEASSPLTLTDLGILVSKAVVEVMDAST